MKVLIIGFPRSGTSLTHRIFKRHRDIMKMYFESLLLWRHRDKKIENLFPGFKPGENVGEKIIYEKPFIGKTSNDKFVDYCDWWNERFGNEARIVQVMRHPYDAWNSIIKKKYIARRIPDKVCKNLKLYFRCVPEYMQKISNYENAFTFKMEHLISNPEIVLPKLYNHCGLDPSRSKFNETLKQGKSFNYKRAGFIIDQDKRVRNQKDEFWEVMKNNLPGLIAIMNQFEGPKYEV